MARIWPSRLLRIDRSVLKVKNGEKFSPFEDMPNDSKKPSNELSSVDQQSLMLRKPVQAIHMAIVGSQQTRTQRLAFNAMLKHAHHVRNRNPEKDFETFEISRKELMEMINYTSPNRQHLKKTLSEMQTLRVQWDVLEQGGSVWKSSVMLPYIEVHTDKIVYSYAPQIKELLFDADIYAMLDLRIQRRFSLDCSTALYEWVNRFRRIGVTAELPWTQWRWTIYGDISPTSGLHEYKIFKRDKLKPAIAEINQVSDLTITLRENRAGGRSVKFLQFQVEEKPLYLSDSAGEPDSAEWDQRLVEVGVNDKDRKRILRKFSAEVIEAHYTYTMKRVQDTTKLPLKNIGAYLVHALENGYANDLVKQKQSPEAPKAAAGMDQLMSALHNGRNSEAASMFAEMPSDDQESAIAEYNALQTIKAALVPELESKRVPRVMVPFYAWLASKYWGEPDANELLAFGLKHGLITLPPEVATGTAGKV